MLDKTHIYQSFFFDNRIKEHFYTGNASLGYRKDMQPGELLDMACEILEEGEKSFVPELVNNIEALLGEKNFVYDFWEFGADCFSLYWWIRKDVYHEKMKLIRQWLAYEGIEKWVEIS